MEATGVAAGHRAFLPCADVAQMLAGEVEWTVGLIEQILLRRVIVLGVTSFMRARHGAPNRLKCRERGHGLANRVEHRPSSQATRGGTRPAFRRPAR